MAIPAKSSLHSVSLHGPITCDGVFNLADENMSVMGNPSREGWPIIKTPTLRFRAFFDGPFENILGIPELKDFLFELDKLGLGLGLLEQHECNGIAPFDEAKIFCYVVSS